MKTFPSHVSVSLLALLAFFPGSRPALPQIQVTQELVGQSTIIFKGSVEKTGASNLKILPASTQTVLVRVEEVLFAAKTMADLKGAVVTLLAKQPESFKAGDRATFFTTGWLYGENAALQEVAHISGDQNSDALRKQIADFQTTTDDQQVIARIQHATMVVAGKVLAARRFVSEGPVRFNSEHDPEWWTADIEVQSYLKGQPAAAPGRVTVLYANSHDVMWVRSPKLKEGDQGIWIVLEYKPGGFFPQSRGPILAVLSFLDFHPMAERDRIGRLVKASQ